MMDEYYLTGNYVSSLLTGQLIGCLVLMALNATCSLHAGVIKEDKQGVEVPCPMWHLDCLASGDGGRTEGGDGGML